MKLYYFLLFYFTNGINPTKGQVHLQMPGEMLLRFVFHPDYNYYEKSCCKVSSYLCIIFVTSNGQVHPAYKARLETYIYSGTFDVRIWNVNPRDAGKYRCKIHGSQIYQEFQVDIADIETELNPILAFPKSTITPLSSEQHLLDQHPGMSSNKWSLKFTLGTIFGIVVIVLITSITLTIVYYKKKSRDKCHRGMCVQCHTSASSVTQLPQEIVYTTVDFKPNQETSNIYANLDIHNSRPDSGNTQKTQDSVEYATVASV